MPHDSSRRDFLKKATYVPPLLLSFHAAPSFARPGSVPVGPPQAGIQTLKPDVQTMNTTIASATEPAASPRSAGRGAGGGSSSGLDLPEFGNAASTGGPSACEPVDDDRYGLHRSASAASREAGSRAPRVTVGACSDEAVARSGADALRELSSKLWKSGG
jgi:hypothetical protein